MCCLIRWFTHIKFFKLSTIYYCLYERVKFVGDDFIINIWTVLVIYVKLYIIALVSKTLARYMHKINELNVSEP
jgi:hypothetical protein